MYRDPFVRRLFNKKNQYTLTKNNKTGIVRIASGIQTFLERYDDNKAPIGMSGGTGYFFKDAGSIMSRSITFPDDTFKQVKRNHETVDSLFATTYAMAIEGYVAKIEDLLVHRRSDITDYKIIDDVNSHLHFSRSQSILLKSLTLIPTETEGYVNSVISYFGLFVTSSSNLLSYLLKYRDYQIDASTLRYSPDSHAVYAELNKQNAWSKIYKYLGL